MRRHWRLVALAALLAGGCGTWFGESDGPPLPGKRVSVLEHQRGVSADPLAAAEPILLASPVTNAEWPQAGGNAAHDMQVLEAAAIGRPRWEAGIGAGVASSRPVMPSPVVAGGRVFTVDTENVVSAFDMRTGRRQWEVDLVQNEDDDDAAPGGLAWDDGRLFVTTGFGKVIALDAASGKRLWRRSVDMPVHAPPTVADGRLFFITVENQLRALSAADGSDIWPPYQALGELARLLGGPSPAAAGGVVVAPFSSGELVALRGDNGRSLWADSLAPARRTDELSSLAQIRARPAISGGRVVAISAGGILGAFDVRTGQRLWDRELGGQQSPWIAGRQVYLIANDGQLVCLSFETGRILWVTQLPTFDDEKKRKDPIFWAGPVLVRDGLLLAGTNGKIMTVAAQDGRIISSNKMADRFSVAPVVAEGAVFLLDDDGTLAAYR